MTISMYKLPFDKGKVSYIGNYVNHGARPQNIAPDGDKYSCVVDHKAAAGWYYYQAQTGEGYTNPVRIWLRYRIIL